ncbi:MAG: DUF4191 family protein, partial [Bifidobacterium sp.]|nr:DUF4191 family protein [Bifidobacterium sp.]
MSPSTSSTARAVERERKREEKRKRKAAKGPGIFAQMKQVFQMTKEREPNILLWMILLGLGVLLVFLLIGVLLGNWLTWLLIGIPFGILAAVILL